MEPSWAVLAPSWADLGASWPPQTLPRSLQEASKTPPKTRSNIDLNVRPLWDHFSWKSLNENVKKMSQHKPDSTWNGKRRFFSNDFRGSLWLSVPLCGSLFFPVAFCGSLLLPVGPCGPLCIDLAGVLGRLGGVILEPSWAVLEPFWTILGSFLHPVFL